MECPNCGSDHITHSYRRGMEKMYRYIYPRTPYRCKECWSRFWVFEIPFQTLTSKVAAGASAVVLLVLLIWPLTAGNEDKPGLKPGPKAVVTGTAERQASDSSAEVGRGSALTRQELPIEDEDRTGSSYLAKRPETSAGEEGSRSAERTRMHEETRRTAFESAADGRSKTAGEQIRSVEEAPGIGTESPVSSETEPSETAREAISAIPVITSTETVPPETDTPETDRIEESNLKVASPERENRQKAPEASATEPEPPAAEPTQPGQPSEPEPQSAQAQPKAEAESTEARSEIAVEKTKGPEDIRRKPADEPKPVKRAVKTARKPDTRFRRLSEIVPKPAGDRFEALIKADGGITDYRSFFLKSPPKLVIDIPGKWEQKTRSVIEMDHDLVKRVRVGEHPEFIRVVLDLEKEKVSKPDFTETAEGLRVSLTRDSE